MRNETCYNVIRMTSEERFTRIENLLAAMTEHHAQFQEEIRQHREESLQFEQRHNKEMAEIREMQNEFAAGMLELKASQEQSKQRQDRHDTEMEEIRQMSRVNKELMRTIEENLNALIKTVDEIIRGRKN